MATIEIGGQKVDIPDDMMWASEETQKRIEKLLGGKGSNARGGLFGQAQKSSQGVSKNLNVMGTSIAKINPGLRLLETGFNTLGSAISGAAGLVAGVFESTGRFSDLNPVVDLATQKFVGLVGSVPIVGGFVAGLAEASAEILKLRLGLMDLQADTFETLALSGAKLDQNFARLITDIIDSNIPLNQFNEIVRENTEGILAFGGNTQRAFTRFNQNITELTDLDSPIGLGLRTLGLGATDIADYFAEFIQNNRFSSRVMGLQNSELQRIMAERIRDERVITEITGIRADEQRAAQSVVATQSAFLAALREFPAETQVALKDYVSKLQAIDPIAAQRAMEQVITNNVVSDETARFASLLPDVNKTVVNSIELIKAGNTDVAGEILDFSLSAKKFATSAEGADLAILGIIQGGEEIGNTVDKIFKFGLRIESQEMMLAEINDKLGTSFESLTAGVDAIELAYQSQIDAIAKNIKAEKDLSPEDQLKKFRDQVQAATDIDDEQTLNLIAARAGFEQAVSSFQKETFKTLMDNFEGLSTVIRQLTENMNKLLDSIDKPGASNEDNRQEPQGTGGGFFETFKDLFGGGSAGSGGQMNRQFGGPIGASMVSLVGEAGRELLKMGNSGGEVINNTTTEKIMGAANAVVNNIGNDSMDTLKQISSTLAQSNQIQSNILKETRRSKGFEY